MRCFISYFYTILLFEFHYCICVSNFQNQTDIKFFFFHVLHKISPIIIDFRNAGQGQGGNFNRGGNTGGRGGQGGGFQNNRGSGGQGFQQGGRGGGGGQGGFKHGGPGGNNMNAADSYQQNFPPLGGGGGHGGQGGFGNRNQGGQSGRGGMNR